jgi:hypothetical protein
MHLKYQRRLLYICLVLAGSTQAHDPIFGIGPHVLFKGGTELHLGVHQEKDGGERNTESELEFKYGLTGDWSVGVGTAYARETNDDSADSGRAASSLSTKYRFWRNDMLGAQASAAVLVKVIFDDADIDDGSPLAADDKDYLLGLTYGYEGRKWYRWASVRHRSNSDAVNGAERPDIWLVDLAVGVRPIPSEYLEPDWVWMVELNGEISGRVSNSIADNTLRFGGEQWFVSPGLMWTWRNVAVKTGLQLPVYDDLEGEQSSDDYRVKLEFEWHL